MIKILIDMNFPPKWVDVFDAEGWEAIHWSKIGDFSATDQRPSDYEMGPGPWFHRFYA